MNLNRLKFFQSKNKRMFFWNGLILILVMLLFFILNNKPKQPNVYISFGFIWLSVIISACLLYLTPRNDEKLRNMIMAGNCIYIPVITVLNIFLVRSSTLLVQIIVDFLLTFGILIYGMILNYFRNNTNDKQF